MGWIWLLPLWRRLCMEVSSFPASGTGPHPHMRCLGTPRIAALAHREGQGGSWPLRPVSSASESQRNQQSARRARADPDPGKHCLRAALGSPLLAFAIVVPPVAVPCPPCLWPASLHPVLRHECDPKLWPAAVPVAGSLQLNFAHDPRCLRRAGAAVEHRVHALRRQGRTAKVADSFAARHGCGNVCRGHAGAVRRLQ